jgi:hypothetical protein
MALLPLSEMLIGEPDENAEYFAAKRQNTDPIFLRCFYRPPSFPAADFHNGAKYFLYGQKGTGKTAILRSLEREARKADANAKTEFLVFKKAIIEEADLLALERLPVTIDEEEVKRTKHYHHALKRLIVLVLLSKILRSTDHITDSDIQDENHRSLIKRLVNSPVADVIRLGFDSIYSLLASAQIDIKALTDGSATLNAGRVIKRSNDDLTRFLCRRAKAQSVKARLYIDEIHFAYRDEASLRNDAMLVRDLILACQSLNDRFAEDGIDIVIVASIRSEFLEHPIIATADVNHAVESVGHRLIWENFRYDHDHPLFGLMNLRMVSKNYPYQRMDCLKYLSNIPPREFLDYTWSKLRDLIRFFRCAASMYPGGTTLTQAQINAIMRNYATQSWNEMQAASAAFLPPAGVAKLEDTLAKNAPLIFDGSLNLTVNAFKEMMKPIYDTSRGELSHMYDFEHFMRLLYILGIFSTRRQGARDQDIYYSYDRGNKNFHASGDVMVHPAVLKAFG